MTMELVRGLVSISVYFSTLCAVLIYISVIVCRSNLALFRRRQELDGWERFDLYSALIFVGLAALAGISTWYYIAGFFKETFLLEGQGNWLLWAEKSDLFVQAYRLVSLSEWQWFWSSQLLMAACSFVGFLLNSGRRDAWAFVLLGFFGAISVALALFISDQIARRALSRFCKAEDPVARTLVGESQRHRLVFLPIIAGLLSIMANSWIHPTSYFYMPNLIFLHIILFVPFTIDNRLTRNSPQSWRYFWLITAIIVAMYMTYQWGMIGRTAHHQGGHQTGKQLFAAIFANNCQISITLDLFYVTVAVLIGVAWALTVQFRVSVGQHATLVLSMLALLALVPLLSVSLSFPLLMALAGLFSGKIPLKYGEGDAISNYPTLSI